MIVRLMGEGQFRVDDALLARLNELDDEVSRAVAEGDERALWTGLQALADAVREGGEKLADEDLRPSDAIIPPEDLSLEEARELLADEGFIPDVPVVDDAAGCARGTPAGRAAGVRLRASRSAGRCASVTATCSSATSSCRSIRTCAAA